MAASSTLVASSLLTELIHTPLFMITLTLAAYKAGVVLYERCNKLTLMHPIITSATGIAIVIYSFGISYEDYAVDTELLYFLMGPATVGLAIPLHQQFHHIKTFLLPILFGVTLGGITAAFSSIALAKMAGGSTDVILSLAPKSVTTPIAINIIDIIGGNASLAAGVVVVTGVVGTIIASLVFRLLNITDHRIIGFTLGLAAHGIGTARAFDISEEAGAFASLALGLTGVLTAMTLPLVMPLIL